MAASLITRFGLFRRCNSSLSQIYNIGKRPLSTTVLENNDEFQLKYLDGESEGVALFLMNRPHARNAFGRKFLAQYKHSVEKVKFDKNIRVVILCSAVPGTFSAGADLKERAQMTNEEVGPFVAGLRAGVSDMSNLPQPTIAAIDGFALGGGMEIALSCCMRVASNSAKMGLVEAALGLIPGGGGTQRMARAIGPAKAKELIYTARMITGTEAYDLGLLNHVVEQNEAGDAAFQRSLALAQEILKSAPVAVRMAKQAINRGLDVDLNTGLQFEEACYAQVIPTKDRVEALKAFKEKRKPKFIGE